MSGLTRGTFCKACAGAVAGMAWGTPRVAWPFFAFDIEVHDERKRTLAEQAQLLKELGYDGAGHLWLDQAAERLATLEDCGLRLFQIYVKLNITPGHEKPYDPKLKEVLPKLKGRNVMLAVLSEGGKPSDESGDPRAVELLREIADMAAPYGVRVALYHHVRAWLERFEDNLRVAKKVDRANVGAMFNLCHWSKVGDEAALPGVLRSGLPQLMAVSINGMDKVADIQAGKGNWIQPLGSGSFDMYGFLKMLGGVGYRGPIGLQCWGIKGDARVHLTQSIGAWKELCTRLNAES